MGKLKVSLSSLYLVSFSEVLLRSLAVAATFPKVIRRVSVKSFSHVRVRVVSRAGLGLQSLRGGGAH